MKLHSLGLVEPSSTRRSPVLDLENREANEFAFHDAVNHDVGKGGALGQVHEEKSDTDPAFDTGAFCAAVMETIETKDNTGKLEEGYLLFGRLFEDLGKSFEQAATTQGAGDDPPETAFDHNAEQELRRTHPFQASSAFGLESAVLLDFTQARLRQAHVQPEQARSLDRVYQRDENEVYTLGAEGSERGVKHGRQGAVVKSDLGFTSLTRDIDVTPAVSTAADTGKATLNQDLTLETTQIPAAPFSTFSAGTQTLSAQDIPSLSRLPQVASVQATVTWYSPQALRISLHPVELGRVDVSVARRGGTLHVTLVPTTDIARDTLMADAHQLLERLGLSQAGSGQIELHINPPDEARKATHEGLPHNAASRDQNMGSPHQGETAAQRRSHKSVAAWLRSKEEDHPRVENMDIARRPVHGVYI